MKKYYMPIVALGFVLSAPSALAADAADVAPEYVTVRTVDFSGKPPFARRTETLPATAVAKLEPAAPMADDPAGRELVTVRTTNFGGKPPFNRRTETLTVAEVARLEASGPTLAPRVETGGRPSFRRDRSLR